MRSLRSLIQRHPALTYFLLTFGISWGGMLVVIGPGAILGTKEEFERLFPIALSMLVLGPSISGLLLTGLVAGRPGLRELRSSLLAWRVSGRWYAAALLTAPLYFTAAMLALSVFSREFLPGIFTTGDKGPYLLRGIVVAVVAGVVEELGWTGFAVPTLRRRHAPVTTGLIVGVLWGVWHFLPKVWGAAAYGLGGYMIADLTSAVVALTGYRILMVWVHDRSRSLLVAVLMHMGLTASTLILQPVVTGASMVTVAVVLAVAPWVIVAAVALAASAASSGTRQRWQSPGPARP
jgi:uncharacterized protein